MRTSFTGKRNKRGDWKPDEPIRLAPVLVWPPQPMNFLRWLFGYPGYLWPWNLLYMALPLLVWFYFTPPMESMKTFQPGWIAYIFVRNLILIMLYAGAWHLWLHVKKAQGFDFKYTNKWLARGNAIFLFRNQLYDNLFWTVACGVPIWTAWEALTWWLYANGMIPWVDWRIHPLYSTALYLLIPIIREVHFYWIHRLIHWEPLYKRVHYLHHNNVDVGPFAGLSMHPVEHLIYFSGVMLHWILPSHPLHALFHLQHAGITPAQGHAGFETVVLHEGVEVKTGDFFHYLHHKYFECNYGGDGPMVLDKFFGTFHDGTDAATDRMNARFLARAKQKQQGGG